MKFVEEFRTGNFCAGRKEGKKHVLYPLVSERSYS